MPLTLDSTLKQMARQSEERNAASLAQSLGVGYALLEDFPFNLDVLLLVPYNEVKEKQYAAYIRSESKVRIAVVHGEDAKLLEYIRSKAAVWGKEIEILIVSPTSLNYLLAAYARLLEEQKEANEAKAAQSAKTEQKDYFHQIQTLTDLQKQIPQVPPSELLTVILAAAVNLNASDVHLEPGEQELVVRFRIDGVLQKVLQLGMDLHHPIISRLKVLTSLKLDVQNTTQDGRFSLNQFGSKVDIRVSTIPTAYGEGVVMRLLHQDAVILDLPQLGFSLYNQQLLEKAIHKPYGLIIITGPTGSGKSTTLYALLKLLNTAERKIITLEDPVEYHLPGLQQSQINVEKGFTFAEGLKGALRQDPDVIMVGEIRDAETATIALNASLTGHLVLTTLHTNNAVSAPIRFLEMGIAPFLLTGSIQAIVAQRLVRKLIPSSSAEDPHYAGRVIIGEVLCPNQEFEQAVLQRKDSGTLEDIAVRGGMQPIMQDGLAKVKQGITTEAEVYRVTAA